MEASPSPERMRRSAYTGVSLDLVLANIFRRPLEKGAAPVSRRQPEGGRCVLSGFGPADLAGLAEAWEGCGYRGIREAREGEWACLTLLREGGVIVGLMEGALYDTNRVQLNPGDFLVLYTDGITEALNPYDDIFGEERLLHAIERSAGLSAEGILDYILDEVIDFTHGYLQSDDLTLVVLKVK